VPVRVDGFKDLDQRVKSQENQIQMFRNELYMIQDKLNQIQSRHDLVTSVKLEDCRRRHIALARRSLSLAAKVQVLKNRGYALQPEEEQLKKRLEGLSRLVNDPASSGRMNEIWARMMVVQEKAKVMEESVGKVDIVWDEKQLQTAGKVRRISLSSSNPRC
jgi:nuclear pore complex protein Nup54